MALVNEENKRMKMKIADLYTQKKKNKKKRFLLMCYDSQYFAIHSSYYSFFKYYFRHITESELTFF